MVGELLEVDEPAHLAFDVQAETEIALQLPVRDGILFLDLCEDIDVAAWCRRPRSGYGNRRGMPN